MDNGHGMDPEVLRGALRFGGTTRFNNRSGLGRYGMGLPNASLSQARRLEVYSWQEPKRVFRSHLDVDEIAGGKMRVVPRPEQVALPGWLETTVADSGTLVVLSRCDRLDNRRIATITRKANLALGRIYRHFLWSGLEISVNGGEVVPVDPLFVREPSIATGGREFAEPLIYDVRSTNGAGPQIGRIKVRFSELPVQEWHDLPRSEKRRLGITSGAGVSIVRGGREVDYGWFLLKGKRKENYDDWWRAEISFDPVLDEYFGITHTKQQIRASEDLLEIIGSDIVDTARVLNRRVRDAHLGLKLAKSSRSAEVIAEGRERQLPALPRRKTTQRDRQLVRQLHLHKVAGSSNASGCRYKLVESDAGSSTFIRTICDGDSIALLINPRHRFYQRLYGPLTHGECPLPAQLSEMLQLLLLSAARAEASMSAPDRRAVRRYIDEWSSVLQVLLKQ